MRNYTTTIAATKTVGEIQTLLAKYGAARIMTEYAEGAPIGITFELDTAHGVRSFTLPVDVRAMQRGLNKAWREDKLPLSAKQRSLEHAERVAWRVLKDWIDAQMTLVASSMAALDQVMLPYLRVDDARTLYQAYRERENVLAIGSSVSD